MIFRALLSSLLVIVSASAGDNLRGYQRPPGCGVNDTLSLNNCYWIIRYSPGMRELPNSNNTGGWSFTFPRSKLDCYLDWSCDAVHYITTPFTNSVAFKSSTSITMTFRIEVVNGDPIFGYRTQAENTGNAPLSVRFLLERENDNLCAILENPDPNQDPCRFWRWWSNPISAEISGDTGTVTLTAPLAPGYWSSVFGEFNNTPNGFDGWQDVLDNIGYIGMTFGGGSFFGHGGFVIEGTGSAKFVLLDFRLD